MAMGIQANQREKMETYKQKRKIWETHIVETKEREKEQYARQTIISIETHIGQMTELIESESKRETKEEWLISMLKVNLKREIKKHKEHPDATRDINEE